MIEIADDHEALTFHPIGIGDVNSNEKGSGARFNAGKPDLAMIPLRVMADAFRGIEGDPEEQQIAGIEALDYLGEFQEGGDSDALELALVALGLTDGFAECARVFSYGAKKYAAWNWSKGMAWSVPLACAARHIVFGILNGEEDDPESGLPHRGHVFCNVVMLMTYLRTYPEGDDRPKEFLA